MTEKARQYFLLAVRETLRQAFDDEELEQEVLEANVGPVHRALILVFDESFVPSHPHLPEPTIKMKDGNEIFFIFLLNEIATRASDGREDASETWDAYSASEKHLRRLTEAKRLSATFPNPLTNQADLISASHNDFSPAQLKYAYCEIARHNKDTSPAKAGKARGAQRKREVEQTTIPKLELAIETLREEGKKPTQKAVAERSGFGIATVKRHWKHDRIASARKPA